MSLRLWLVLWTLMCAAALAQNAPASASPELPEFNRIVLQVISEYPTDGTHGYWWPRDGEGSYDGVTHDLYFRGEKVMEGEPQGRTFCCGLTLEVFLEAYKRWLAQHGGEETATLRPEDWPEFQRLWFVVETNGPGPSAALEQFGLGRTIRQEEALPGDFVQIWRRQGSGHSVIFLDWVRDEAENIVGFHYWSTQPSTNGIHEATEHFASPEADEGVAAEHTHWGRVELAVAGD